MNKVAGLAVVGALAGCSAGSRLDGAQAEREMKAYYDAIYPVGSVNCPDQIRMEAGTTFACTLIFRGGAEKFEVRAKVRAVSGRVATYEFLIDDTVFEPGPTAKLAAAEVKQRTQRDATVECGEPRRPKATETCTATFADGVKWWVVVHTNPDGSAASFELAEP